MWKWQCDEIRGCCVGCEFPSCGAGLVANERVVSIRGLKESNSPRLRCYVSSAIVLVIVNLRHLPGGISHSSNKFHKTNHRELHWWLPLIQCRAHAHIPKCLTAATMGYLEWRRHARLFIYYWAASLGSLRSEEKGGGWKADWRGLGWSAIFQQARHTTWSLITHKACV